jgi:hypothetical protein
MISRLIIFISLLTAIAEPSAWLKNRSANSLYKKKKFAEAEKEFKNAQIEAPEIKELAYNRGCALYQKGEFENAAKEFEKAKSLSDPILKRNVAFNTANSLFKQGLASQDESGRKNVEEAAKIYKDILKREPSHLPSRQNLEKALHVIEQMKKNEQENKDKKDNKDNKDQQKDKNEKSENNKDDKKQDDKNKNESDNKDKKDDKQDSTKDDKQDEQKQDEQQQPKPKPGEMSKEEAQKLLDALREDEQEKQKKLMQLRARGKKLEKDW